MGAGGTAAATRSQARPPLSRTATRPRPSGTRGVMYVLRTGVAWRDVPAETVGCSGVMAWRRLRDWTEAGVWPRLHAAMLAELRRGDLLDLSDCAVDGHTSARSQGGSRRPLARRPGPSRLQASSDRQSSRTPACSHAHRRQPTRRHSALAVAGCSPADSAPAGRPRRKPRRLYADCGYDFDKYRRLLWKRGIKPLIARRGVAPGSTAEQGTLGGGTHLRLTVSVQTTSDPLRTTRRPTPMPARTGLQPHLPQTP